MGMEEFKYLDVLFLSVGRVEREMYRQIRASVMRALLQSVVVKKKLSQKSKLSLYWSVYVPTLAYGVDDD